MPATRNKKDLTPEEQRVRLWLKRNWGVLSFIALKCGVRPQFVQAIAYGNNHTSGIKGPKVEKELRSKGWPGIRRKL